MIRDREAVLGEVRGQTDTDPQAVVDAGMRVLVIIEDAVARTREGVCWWIGEARA